MLRASVASVDLEDAPAQRLEVDADLPRRLRHQRMAGHAGRGVHFEQEVCAPSRSRMTSTRPQPAQPSARSGQRERADLVLGRRRRGPGRGTACPRRRTWRGSRRTRPSARCGSTAAPARRRAIADGELVALDHLLDQQLAGIARGELRRPRRDRRRVNTRVTPTLEPSRDGLTITGRPSSRRGAHVRVAARLGAAHVARRRQALRRATPAWCGPCPSTAPSRARPSRCTARASDSSAPCSMPSSPPPLAVQDVEHARVMPVRAVRIEQRRDAVDRVRVDAARAQRREHVAARIERHLALGRLCRPSARRRGRSCRDR